MTKVSEEEVEAARVECLRWTVSASGGGYAVARLGDDEHLTLVESRHERRAQAEHCYQRAAMRAALEAAARVRSRQEG